MSAAGAASLALPRLAGGADALTPKMKPGADAMVVIWLPGGIAQTDTWDHKRHTPFSPNMRGHQLLGTCPPLRTPVDDITFGTGLEHMARVMDRGTLLRSLISDTKFGAIHLKAQYYAMTGYLFPAGVKAPSIGSVVARTLGKRAPNVPTVLLSVGVSELARRGRFSREYWARASNSSRGDSTLVN